MFRIMEDITKMCVGFLWSFFLASKVAELILSVDFLCTKNVAIRYSRAQLFALRRSRDHVYIDQLAALSLLKFRGCRAGFNQRFRHLSIQPCLHESFIANGIPTLIGCRPICRNKFGSGTAPEVRQRSLIPIMEVSVLFTSQTSLSERPICRNKFGSGTAPEVRQRSLIPIMEVSVLFTSQTSLSERFSCQNTRQLKC